MNYEVNDFALEVTTASHQRPVVVDFWAEWCGPCRLLAPILERLEETDSTWDLAKVDVDRHQSVAQQYNVRSIPNVKLFIKGEVVNEFTGALPEAQIIDWLAKSLPDEKRTALSEALEYLAEGNREEALARLETLASEPNAPNEAQIFLAQTLVLSDPQRAAELVAEIRPHEEHAEIANDVKVLSRLLQVDGNTLPEHSAKASYLAGREALKREQFEVALENFINTICLQNSYDDAGARKACIAIFNLLGHESDLVKQFRRPLQNALN